MVLRQRILLAANEGELRMNADIQQTKNIGTKREAGLDLLRLLAMMMVVVLHYLGKGKLLPDLSGETLGSTGTVAWLLEALCIVAVNTYMFISGYFLCQSSFKVSRLIQLWLQIWVYSVGFGLLGALSGIVMETPVDIHYVLTLIFPVSMGHYWFMSAYVYMYLLLPLVGIAVRHMSKKQMQWSIGLLLFAYSILKSVLPLRLELDAQGYDAMWYLCVFLLAAYVRKFGLCYRRQTAVDGHVGEGGLAEWKCEGGEAPAVKGWVLLYLGGALLVFGGLMGMRALYLKTGSFQRMLKMSMEYNHIFVLLASLGLFMVFKNLKVTPKLATVAKKIAPLSLGVYLLHENIGLRYTWQNWLGANRIETVPGLIAGVIIAAIVVFVCGILVDAVRKFTFGLLHNIGMKLPPYKAVCDWIGRADQLFARNQETKECDK